MENVLTRVNGDVAGIDVGSRQYFVGVNTQGGGGEVKNFDTYTDGCRQLLAYLLENGQYGFGPESDYRKFTPNFTIVRYNN